MITIWTSMLLGAAQLVAPGSATPVVPGITAPVPATRARAFLPGYFSTADYPAAALRNRESGLVSFSLAIDRDGRVTRCTVTKSSGSTALDQTTCAIVQRRARFTPARDERGRAVEDFVNHRIRWELPAPPPLPVADQYRRLVYAIDAAGRVGACRAESLRVVAAPTTACDGMLKIAQAAAATSKSGGGARELVLEAGTLVGERTASRRLATGPGETRLELDAVALAIDPAGKVIRCVGAEGTAMPALAESGCRQTARSFVPLASNAPDRRARHLIIYQLSYTRPVR